MSKITVTFNEPELWMLRLLTKAECEQKRYLPESKYHKLYEKLYDAYEGHRLANIKKIIGETKEVKMCDITKSIMYTTEFEAIQNINFKPSNCRLDYNMCFETNRRYFVINVSETTYKTVFFKSIMYLDFSFIKPYETSSGVYHALNVISWSAGEDHPSKEAIAAPHGSDGIFLLSDELYSKIKSRYLEMKKMADGDREARC